MAKIAESAGRTTPHRPAFAGAVLTGGRSFRMGTDKALLAVGGRPMVTYARDALRAAGATEVLAVGGDAAALAALASLGLRPVADPLAGAGPLAGIVAALEAAEHEVLAVLACDTPLVPAQVIVALLDVLGAATAGDGSARAAGTVAGGAALAGGPADGAAALAGGTVGGGADVVAGGTVGGAAALAGGTVGGGADVVAGGTATGAVAVVGGRLQPLIAVYTRGLLGPFAAELKGGGSVHAVISALRLPTVVFGGSDEQLALNVNSPADVAVAERLLTKLRSPRGDSSSVGL